MHHVRVALNLHQRVNDDRAVLADAAKIVAAKIDQHHVLGALLLVREQTTRELEILGRGSAARARSGDRARRGRATAHGQQRFRAGANDLEVAKLKEVHVRARIYDAQATVDRERINLQLGGPALRRDHLESVAGVDVVDDFGNDILKLLAREVRFKLRRLTLRTGRLERRQWAVKQRANLSNRGGSLLIARVAQLALLGDGVYEDRQAVAQVVEDDQHVAAHQRHVG